MASLETQFRTILKENGFETASLEMEFSPKPRRDYPNQRNISNLIASWANFPECMNVYPSVLSKKDNSYLKG